MGTLPASIPACLHPAVVLAVSCLHLSLVLQPVSATRHLPRGFKGLLPSLRALHRTLLRDEKREGEEVGTPGLFNLSLAVLCCSCWCPCLGAGEIHQAGLGVGSPQRQPPKGEQLKFCLWQEGSAGKSWVGTVTSVAPASRELSRFVQPRVMAELRLDCSRSFCSQTLIFASRYGVEMFDFTALVYIAGK